MVDDELMQEAMTLLPQIGKLLHATTVCHPITVGRSIAQVRAMVHLYHHGQCTAGEVAHAVGLSKPAASELIERLVEDGLAERAINPADRRQVIVGLTPAAMQAAHEIHALRRAQLQSAMERLDPAERPVFVRSLRALADALRASVEQQHLADGQRDLAHGPPASQPRPRIGAN